MDGCVKGVPLFKPHGSHPTEFSKLTGEIERPKCVSFARAKEKAPYVHRFHLRSKEYSLKGMAFESLQLKKKKKLSRHWNKLPYKSLPTLPTDPPPYGGLEERHKYLRGAGVHVGSHWPGCSKEMGDLHCPLLGVCPY